MEIKSDLDDQNQILLEETFYVLTKKNCVFKVRLTKIGLCLIKENENNIKEQMIPICDIIGCRCLRSKKQSSKCICHSIPRSSSLEVVEESSGDLDDSDSSTYLYVYAYIFQNSKGINRRRERTIITLRFRSFDKYEDNNKEAQKWRTAIKKLIRGETVTRTSISDFNVNNKHKENQRLLILCNPKSGAGKGKYIFQQKVVPILQEAEMPFDLFMTRYANFARDFVRTNNLYQWTGIVVVGGDGIVFEVINGIFERNDWCDIITTLPVSVIPSGSGNGLARSIAHHSGEPYTPIPTLPSALAAVRGKTAPMDLVRVETTSDILFSFLSVGWGLLSDVDVESERLRALGGRRFAVWSVARLIGLRSYGGRIWYLPVNKLENPSSTSDKAMTINGDGETDLPSEVHLETQTGRQRIDSWYSATSRRSAYFSATGSSYQSTTDSSPVVCDRPRTYGPASKIPGLPASLPLTWKCISGRFIMVHAAYQSHLGEDCLFAPEARLDDGRIWLLIVKAGATRSQVLRFLLGLSTGAHAENANKTQGGMVELIPVSAFRIEPDVSENGYMTVDGEHIEYGPIQAEIFPSLGRVMVP